MAPAARDVHEGDESENAGIEENQSTWESVWDNNRGMLLILISEIFGSSMDCIARFLQQGDHSMHPFQLVIFRMGTTFILSSLYMWYTNVPKFPLGAPSVRGWLILRSLFGFTGLLCLYYSVHYLPLAEATVFRFLVPIVTAFSCSIFLGQSFTKKEFVAGLVALLGVIVIAHPASIFGRVENDLHATKAGVVDDVSPTQRLIAIVLSLLGVVGASGAYTTIRVIGDRAHALISVNYFAALGTSASTVALLVIPGIGFTMPQGAREWALLLALGVLGFILQFLLTTGLQADKSSKATSMMYAQVLFALAFDWGIWGVLPGKWSLIGGAVVCASTLSGVWSALQKTQKPAVKNGKSAAETVDEESALLGAQAEGAGDIPPQRASNTSA